MKDILYSFMYLDTQEFALTVTDTQGQLHDVSECGFLHAVERGFLCARDFPVVGDREVHLQVQAKLDYDHVCVECGKRFLCIPEGGYTRIRSPPPDNIDGCECHRFDEQWLCSSACYYKSLGDL